MTAGEAGHPGQPGQPGRTGGTGGRGGTGGAGGKGGQGERGPRGEGMTRGARHAVVFLFVLSLLLAGGNYLLSANAVNRATASSASTIQLCRSGNEARAQQVQLWTFVISISRPPSHQTPAEREQRARTTKAFLAYVHRAFAPRDCSRFS